MSEIVFEVLCVEVLEALRGLGLGKFSIRNYYYEGMWPIIKAYRSEGLVFYSIPFTSEVVDRFRAEHENGLVSDHVWMSIRKVKALFEEYAQTGEIIWQRLKPEPKVCISPYYQEILFGFRKHEANTRSIGYGSLRDEENICRRFFAYLDANGRHNCKDIDLTILPLDFTKKTGRHIPYIFSYEELARLFREIDSCAPSLNAPTRHLVVSVIFRMIYCCGLRPVEARRLRREDVSLRDGVVKILESKGHKDRIVVLSESMLALCVTYDQRADTIYPDRKYFFQSPSARGDGMYSMEWMIPTFRRFLHSAGIFGYAGITPRTYDLRHTFATHRLYQWIKEGKDVNACLAYLSEYMGHANLSDTAYYIHLLPTLYTDLPELYLDTLQTEVSS